MCRRRGARPRAGWIWGCAAILAGCAVGTDPDEGLAGPGLGAQTDGTLGDDDDDDDEPSGGGSGGGTDTEGDPGEDDTGGTDGDEDTDGDPGAPPAAICGDGIVDPGEACDDGAANGPDADCTPICTVQACGDGFHRPATEECDDANAVDTDACTVGCTLAVCGDGVLHAGVELCDDGNLDDGDGCTTACTLASCGDGIIQAPEQCDDANGSNADACLNSCVTASCGDGFVQAGVEACDDANSSNADACLNSCAPASCGDGFVYEGVEECDGAGDPTVYSCSASCQDQLVWYQWSFFSGALPNPMACADFTAWRNALADDHTSIHLAGTHDPGGRTCTGPAATTLCNALRTGGTATVGCDGHTWHVGNSCLGTMEVTVDGTSCDCAYPGYALRPCVNLVDWGGAGTSTCGGPTQEIYLECGFD